MVMPQQRRRKKTKKEEKLPCCEQCGSEICRDLKKQRNTLICCLCRNELDKCPECELADWHDGYDPYEGYEQW